MKKGTKAEIKVEQVEKAEIKEVEVMKNEAEGVEGMKDEVKVEGKSKWAAPDGRKWLYNVSLPDTLMSKLKTLSTLTGKKLEEVVEGILTPNVGAALAKEIEKLS